MQESQQEENTLKDKAVTLVVLLVLAAVIIFLFAGYEAGTFTPVLVWIAWAYGLLKVLMDTTIARFVMYAVITIWTLKALGEHMEDRFRSIVREELQRFKGWEYSSPPQARGARNQIS